MAKAPPRLSLKQQLFCREFLKDLCAKQAAIRAGYSPASADINGPRLLSHALVAVRIGQLQAERARRLEITADAVLLELARIAFSDIRRYAQWTTSGVTLTDSATLTEDESRAILEVTERTTKEGTTVKVKLHPKVDALTKLGSHLGLRLQERLVLPREGEGVPPPRPLAEVVTELAELIGKAQDRARLARGEIVVEPQP